MLQATTGDYPSEGDFCPLLPNKGSSPLIGILTSATTQNASPNAHSIHLVGHCEAELNRSFAGSSPLFMLDHCFSNKFLFGVFYWSLFGVDDGSEKLYFSATSATIQVY